MNINKLKTSCNGGFTLVELLVVVLIIGILAAVAVPQYQFAVDKSRVASYMQLAHDIRKAEQVYRLANGEYTNNFTLLDIDFTKLCSINTVNNEIVNCANGFNLNLPRTSSISNPKSIQLNFCQDSSSCRASDNSPETSYHFRVSIDFATNDIMYCRSYTERGQKICKWLNPQ